jgi:hypothetical protein
MTTCPCCSHSMIRHVRQNQVSWFCRHCWQTMPVYDLNRFGSSLSTNLVTELGINKHNFALK